MLLIHSSYMGVSQTSYCNENYRYCIVFAPYVMQVTEEFNNGRGAELKEKNHNFSFEIQGYFVTQTNVKEMMYQTTIKYLERGYQIDHQKTSSNYFIVSASKEGNEIYQKTMYRTGIAVDMIATYTTESREYIAANLKEVFSGFKWL